MHHLNRRTLPIHGPRPSPRREFCARHAATPALFSPSEHAERRFWEFFTAHIRNRNTRLAYLAAVRRFAEWCERRGLALDQVEPMVVAAYVEQLTAALSPASVKQHLAALRMLFDWLVVGQVLPFNPASSVRGCQRCGVMPNRARTRYALCVRRFSSARAQAVGGALGGRARTHGPRTDSGRSSRLSRGRATRPRSQPRPCCVWRHQKRNRMPASMLCVP